MYPQNFTNWGTIQTKNFWPLRSQHCFVLLPTLSKWWRRDCRLWNLVNKGGSRVGERGTKGGVWGGGVTLPRIFFEFLSRNGAFLCILLRTGACPRPRGSAFVSENWLITFRTILLKEKHINKHIYKLKLWANSLVGWANNTYSLAENEIDKQTDKQTSRRNSFPHDVRMRNTSHSVCARQTNSKGGPHSTTMSAGLYNVPSSSCRHHTPVTHTEYCDSPTVAQKTAARPRLSKLL